MYDIYDTLDGNWIFALIILVAIFLSLFSLMPILSLFSKNRKKEINKNIYYLENELSIKKPILIIACLVCTFVLIFSNSVIVWTLDGKTDLRLAPEGVHFYSVIINREDSSSHYTLPAKILKSEGLYYVEDVYFSNGGYLYFDSYEYADFDELINDADQNGEFWEIKITNLKASPPNNMADHYEISFWRLFFVIVPSVLMITEALLLLFTKNMKTSQKNLDLQSEKYRLIAQSKKAEEVIQKAEIYKREHANLTEQAISNIDLFKELYVENLRTINERLAEINEEIIE